MHCAAGRDDSAPQSASDGVKPASKSGTHDVSLPCSPCIGANHAHSASAFRLADVSLTGGFATPSRRVTDLLDDDISEAWSFVDSDVDSSDDFAHCASACRDHALEGLTASACGERSAAGGDADAYVAGSTLRVSACGARKASAPGLLLPLPPSSSFELPTLLPSPSQCDWESRLTPQTPVSALTASARPSLDGSCMPLTAPLDSSECSLLTPQPLTVASDVALLDSLDLSCPAVDAPLDLSPLEPAAYSTASTSVARKSRDDTCMQQPSLMQQLSLSSQLSLPSLCTTESFSELLSAASAGMSAESAANLELAFGQMASLLVMAGEVIRGQDAALSEAGVRSPVQAAEVAHVLAGAEALSPKRALGCAE